MGIQTEIVRTRAGEGLINRGHYGCSDALRRVRAWRTARFGVRVFESAFGVIDRARNILVEVRRIVSGPSPSPVTISFLEHPIAPNRTAGRRLIQDERYVLGLPRTGEAFLECSAGCR